MRAHLLLLALCFVGCGDDSTVADMATSNDLSAAAADLKVSPDLKPQNCLQVITCASGCGTNAGCLSACVAAGSTAAMTKYAALYACAYNHCILGDGGMVSDGGPGSCSSTSDPSMECRSCVSAQAQGAACANELSACLTDS
jgi:hypothetical protein